MKKLSTVLAVTLACSSMVGCSTNTQGQNTGIGAITGGVVGGLAGAAIGGGWAVGIGAVAGAVLGGYIGHSMDHTDQVRMNNAMSNNSVDQPTVWTNPKTGVTYRIVPVSGPITVGNNHDCRRYYTVAVNHGKNHRVYGTACRHSDGKWYTVKTK